MSLPPLPPAIAGRVVPVGYSHIARLLYGYDDTASTKRISGWRRTDPDFPAALSAGRSPTFDVNHLWQWLAHKARSSDGRTQSLMRDMTRLHAPEAAPERLWLLAGLALRYDTGDMRARRWMTALASLRAATDTALHLPDELATRFPDPQTATRLFRRAADTEVSAEQFTQLVVEALPLRPAVEVGQTVTPHPLAPLAEYMVPPDLRVLAAEAIAEAAPTQLARLVDTSLAGDDGSLSSQVDSTSTSPEASQFIVELIDALASALGRTWTTAYDPACGEGHLLAALATNQGQRRWAVHGQDADPDAVALATARLLTTGAVFHTRLTSDTLVRDLFTDLRADVVVADPPQPSGRNRSHDHMDAWWRHIMGKLADEQSLAFVLTSDQPRAQPSDEVMASGHVLAIIETGQRLRRDTPGRSVLWVLTPQRVTHSVRVAVDRDLVSGQGWRQPLCDWSVRAIMGLTAGAPMSHDGVEGLRTWLVAADDPALLRPTGPDGWPSPPSHHLDDLMGRLLEALSRLPPTERAQRVNSLIEQLQRWQ